MKLIQTFLLLVVLGAPLVYGQNQIVFERDLYTSSNKGDITLEDVIVSEVNAVTDLISTGYHIYNQGVSDSSCWAVLTSCDSMGTGNFHKRYQEVDGSSNPYNTKAYDVEEYDGGYIMVGSVLDNPHHGTSVTGGGDIFILKVNSFGVVQASKRVDMGGLEEAFAIAPTKAVRGEFVICGYSNRDSATREVVVLEIDLSLNVNWIKRVDLRLNSSDPEIANLHDIVVDSSHVWSVGSITTSSVINTDGLILKLDLNGNYVGAYNFKNTSSTYEKFFGVDNDGDSLVICGRHSLFSFPGGVKTHAMAHLYKKSTNTMLKNVQLRIAEGRSTYKKTTGFDIKKYDVSGTVGYFVGGESIPSAGPKHGFLYELDNSFNAIRQAHYTAPGNTLINSLDVFEGTEAFISLAGYRSTSSSFLNGYGIKSDLNGYTSCNDTLAPNTTTLGYSPDTLLKDTVIIDSLFTPTIAVDTILDSLVCYDTVGVPTQRNLLLEVPELSEVLISAYPNPVTVGDYLNISVSDGTELLGLSLYDVTGTLLYARDFNGAPERARVPIDTDFASGLYLLTIEFGTGNQRYRKSQSVIVE